MEIVYETLSVPNRAAELSAKRRRVAILWIDDSLLGRQWLSTVTGLLTELSPPRDDVRLRILGPSDSEGLVAALNELTNLDERLRAPDKRVAPDPRNNVPPPAKGSAEAEGLARNWNTLARLSVISANSTAPDEQLLKAARRSALLRVRPAACPSDGQPAVPAIGEVFRQRLHEVHDGLKGIVGQELATPQPPFFLRTIATDDQLVDRLVDELFGRGLATSTGRVALIGEWDSIYARTFAETLQARLLCKGRAAKVEVDLLSYQYLRGLDGVTVEGAPKPSQRDGDSTLRVNDSATDGRQRAQRRSQCAARRMARGPRPARLSAPSGRPAHGAERLAPSRHRDPGDRHHRQRRPRQADDRAGAARRLPGPHGVHHRPRCPLAASGRQPVHAQPDRGVQPAAGARRQAAMRRPAVPQFVSDRDVSRRRAMPARPTAATTRRATPATAAPSSTPSRWKAPSTRRSAATAVPVRNRARRRRSRCGAARSAKRRGPRRPSRSPRRAGVWPCWRASSWSCWAW